MLNSKFVPIILDGSGVPYLDTESRSLDIVNNLSREDFKDNAFTF